MKSYNISNRKSDNMLVNENGNILIVCVVLIMILTSLGIYALNSTNTELTMSAADRRENSNFQNAETGLKFAIANFKLIYENTDYNGNVLYTVSNNLGSGGNIGFNPVAPPWAAGTGPLTGIINPLGPPVLTAAQTTPLRDMPLNTGAIIFTYTANNTPIALIEIRAIFLTPTNNNALTALANSIPAATHLTDAPDGFDSSLFDGRNYIITSTGINSSGTLSGTTLQSGVKIAAQKDQVAHLAGL